VLAGRRLTILNLVGVCLLTVLPVVAAIVLARHQALEREDRVASNLAHLLLARSEETARQLADGSRQINALPTDTACSEASLDRMRRIDLNSTMLQTVGHISGTAIDCSSFAGRRRIELGAPDMISSSGSRLWTGVRLFGSGPEYLAIANGSFVGIVHKNLPLSFVQPFAGLSIGTFNLSNRRILLERADKDADFSADFANTGLHRHGPTTIAIAHSARYDIGSYAALPTNAIGQFVREATLVLVPVALLVGAALSFLFVRAMRARTSMPGLIRWGLRNREFGVVFQPIVDLETGATVGAETLVRWTRARGETVSPETFIPVAEAAGMVGLITARVLELLEPELRRIAQLRPDFYVSINFAADDMHCPAMATKVARFLDGAGFPAERLVIEATERSFVDAARAQDTIRNLRALGVRIAIDDFGTGYSSLAYLARLEIDCIKIDRLFVQALGTDSATSHVAARIIDMAGDLKVVTIAEGVETPRQAEALQRLGVVSAQGFLYGQALSPEDLLQRLRAERFAPASGKGRAAA
jgi:sensor c-di-GMP phosphodiesterase-like protein